MLNNQEIELYSRQLMIKDVGAAGQNKLKQAHVALAGMGGIGCPCAMYLAASGVGKITLIDNDIITKSNLNRQILYDYSQEGQEKVTCAAKKLYNLNPFTEIIQQKQKISKHNADYLFKDINIIIDGTDNYKTKLLLSRFCESHKKILISTALSNFKGYLITLQPFEQKYLDGSIKKSSLRYEDIFPVDNTKNNITSCDELAIIGPVAGVIASLAALETIKQILELKENLSGKLLTYDGITHRTNIINCQF